MSFNGLRAMLTLYMVKGLMMTEHQAYSIYGALLAFAFLSPTIGGVLASHLLNDLQVMRIGSVLGVIGSVLLFSADTTLYFSGFGILILGSGFLRSVIPSVLAAISDKNKDSDFTTLYVFYNLGTLFGVIICAGVGEVYGWRWSFAATGFAIGLACLLIFLVDMDHLTRGQRGLGVLHQFFCVIVGTIAGAAIGLFSFYTNDIADVVIPLLTLSGIGYFLLIAAARLSKHVVGLFSILILSQVVFFALYEQISLSLTLFIDAHVARATDLFKIPTTMFQGVDPFLNVIFGSFIALIGEKLFTGDRYWRPILKNCLGFVITAFVFFSLYYRTLMTPDAQVGIHIIIACMTLFVVAEVLIVPTGFATLAEYAPEDLRSKLMGLWLGSIGGAMWLAGQISKMSAPLLGASKSNLESLHRFAFTFKILCVVSAGCAGFLFLIFLLGRRHPLSRLNSEVPNDISVV